MDEACMLLGKCMLNLAGAVHELRDVVFMDLPQFAAVLHSACYWENPCLVNWVALFERLWTAGH